MFSAFLDGSCKKPKNAQFEKENRQKPILHHFTLLVAICQADRCRLTFIAKSKLLQAALRLRTEIMKNVQDLHIILVTVLYKTFGVHWRAGSWQWQMQQKQLPTP